MHDFRYITWFKDDQKKCTHTKLYGLHVFKKVTV